MNYGGPKGIRRIGLFVASKLSTLLKEKGVLLCVYLSLSLLLRVFLWREFPRGVLGQLWCFLYLLSPWICLFYGFLWVLFLFVVLQLCGFLLEDILSPCILPFVSNNISFSI